MITTGSVLTTEIVWLFATGGRLRKPLRSVSVPPLPMWMSRATNEPVSVRVWSASIVPFGARIVAEIVDCLPIDTAPCAKIILCFVVTPGPAPIVVPCPSEIAPLTFNSPGPANNCWSCPSRRGPAAGSNPARSASSVPTRSASSS